MSFTVTVQISKEIKLDCDFDKAFGIFSDVRKMGSFFPKVEKLEDMGEGAYKWTMEKMGIAKYGMAVVYAARYSFDKEAGRISWSPVPGVGNGQNSGSSKVRPGGPGKTIVDFSTTLTLDIPYMSLAKPIIKPFVESQFVSMMEKFEQNVMRGVK